MSSEYRVVKPLECMNLPKDRVHVVLFTRIVVNTPWKAEEEPTEEAKSECTEKEKRRIK